jgi:acyl-CoA synthetase (AMP-forming)/AMP-acid ligase II
VLSPIRPTHAAARAATYRTDGTWHGETLWDAAAATARVRPDAVAVVDGTARIGLAALLHDAERTAAGLAALGVHPGDAVAVQLPNWHETIVAFLAIVRLGAVVVPVLATHRRRELAFVLGESGARVLVVPGRHRDCDHRDLVGEVRDAVPLAHVVVVRDEPAPGMHAWEALLTTEVAAPAPPRDAEAIALLLYTSGTTADPKGVLHSHETLLAEARSLGPVHGLGADDATLMPSPLAHVSGIVHAVLVPCVLGSRAVLMERWDPTAGLAAIAREGVTYMVGAPTFLRDLASHPALAAHDLSRFRLFSCGGADVDPTLVTEAAARLGCVVKRVYGSSEFPTVTTCGPDDPPARRVETEGRVIGSAELRLLDDDGAPVAAGAEGEVVARGPECFLGYRDATLNADAFTADGWFRTGDLGVVDDAGYLRITGRKKDIVIRKGENISAREVEDAVAAHPAVAEVAVVGLPDVAAGEIACAVVRLRDGAAAPTVDELARFLVARGLSKRKLPERVVAVTEFPRTASGKIVKRALRQRLA